MGLMQLLTVGRSLSEARDRPHRFKLLNSTMPTFGHPNGMENRRNSEGTEEEPGTDKMEQQPDPEEEAMKNEATESIENTEKASGMNAYPLGRWTLKTNPFKSSTKPARQPVVQGELSLDKVKVVRNDLSDSDLELMTGKSIQTEGKGNVFAVPGTAGARVSLWTRVKGRWFGAKAQ